jgi:hypothetical protein
MRWYLRQPAISKDKQLSGGQIYGATQSSSAIRLFFFLTYKLTVFSEILFKPYISEDYNLPFFFFVPSTNSFRANGWGGRSTQSFLRKFGVLISYSFFWALNLHSHTPQERNIQICYVSNSMHAIISYSILSFGDIGFANVGLVQIPFQALDIWESFNSLWRSVI